ncbi:MAG: cation:dicarboxylase symporter family transporter [Gammaproteobacteria bacterium]|nr:MAG: cation:dicarboxylase symporter family transporter [Gammaproteobacteria bacterium]
MQLKLHWQILIALLLAVLVGLFLDSQSSIFSITFASIFEFVGKLFLNALKMIIVPLIVSSIILAISNLGSGDAFGRLGGKTLGYYVMTSAIAILIGITIVNITQPGIIDGVPAKEILGFSENTDEVMKNVEGKSAGDVVEVFLRMVPKNIIKAAAEGQMLGLIFFSLLFGFFMIKIKKELSNSLKNFWEGVYEVMLLITDLVMKFAPIGVFALVANVMIVSGLEAFEPLLLFFFTVLAALFIHIAVVMPLLLKFVGGVSPIKHYQAMMPALLTAFSTASSSATLPVTMDCVRDRAGVSRRTTSFVLPLGATVNMDGTALYECVAAMFIAQAYGLDLTIGTQISIVVLALMTSIGVAGIPSASLVAIAVILAAIGLPAEGIGLILAVDRVLDMCRTAVNVFSDSCGAVIIGRTEGEKGILEA